MKFHEMPYERVQLPDVTHAYEELIKELQAAKSGEEQFAVHQRYYEMRGHVTTQMTIANIRHDIDMTDAFYEKEQEYYDEIGPEIQNLNRSTGNVSMSLRIGRIWKKKSVRSPLKTWRFPSVHLTRS